MFQAMRDALSEQKQNPLSIDDVTAMITGQIGQLAPMDEETADLFQQLAKKMMTQMSMESGFCFCSDSASRMAWNKIGRASCRERV